MSVVEKKANVGTEDLDRLSLMSSQIFQKWSKDIIFHQFDIRAKCDQILASNLTLKFV